MHVCSGDIGKVVKPFKMIGQHGFCRFYFKDIKHGSPLLEQVNFVAVGVAPEPVLPELVLVKILFEEFGDDKVLKQAARKCRVV